MFAESLKSVSTAIVQILFLGTVGYFLVRRKIISSEGLDNLSRLSIDVTLPFLIIHQLVKDFSFSRYPNWWLFPLLSVLITLAGLGIGWVASRFLVDAGPVRKVQFMSLVGFQNSGYLPLALFATLVPAAMRGSALIYLFLFMAGFNLTMFSLGPCLLTSGSSKGWDIKKLLNAPVVAVIMGLAAVAVGFDRLIPAPLLRSVKLVGDCTLPLALFVVGGNLAQIAFRRFDLKAMGLLIAARLIVLPLLGLLAIKLFAVPHLLGILILVQLAVPSAVTLSALVRQYRQEDILISQGILISHLAGMVTMPVFLSIYFTYYMV